MRERKKERVREREREREWERERKREKERVRERKREREWERERERRRESEREKERERREREWERERKRERTRERKKERVRSNHCVKSGHHNPHHRSSVMFWLSSSDWVKMCISMIDLACLVSFILTYNLTPLSILHSMSVLCHGVPMFITLIIVCFLI